MFNEFTDAVHHHYDFKPSNTFDESHDVTDPI